VGNRDFVRFAPGEWRGGRTSEMGSEKGHVRSQRRNVGVSGKDAATAELRIGNRPRRGTRGAVERGQKRR